jgi:eukaryotic-like serine/threonine-protein kinase
MGEHSRGIGELAAGSLPAPATGPARIWSFGDVRLDERTLQLTVRGEEVRLHRKPLLVLLHLLEHPGEVVTKDELAEACWPRRILSDTVLTTTLNRLRQALGDDNQNIIKTVHGFGYRLTASVRVEEAEHGMAPRLALQAGDHPPLRPTWSLLERLGGGGSGKTAASRCTSISTPVRPPSSPIHSPSSIRSSG